MNQSDAAAAYRNATFENAPPIKILRMLYEGAIRFLERAKGEEPGDDEYRRLIRRADDIVIELRASLDPEPNPELSAHLESLYVYVTGELGQAILERDPAHLENAIRVLSTLLEGWAQAQSKMQAGA